MFGIVWLLSRKASLASLLSLFLATAEAIFELTETANRDFAALLGAMYNVIKLFLEKSLYSKTILKSDLEVNLADFENLYFAIWIKALKQHCRYLKT